MKKFKKVLAMSLMVVMALSIMNISVFASEISEEIQFIVTDENGNEVEVLELIYLEDVADAYEQAKLQRWVSTTYYNLSSGPFTMSGNSASVVQCGKHFNANSSGRLYYYGEVTDVNAYVDIYDITNGTYKGSFVLKDQGDGIYSRSGYVTGLSTSSSQYYSFGLRHVGGSNFTTFYTAISWSSL